MNSTNSSEKAVGVIGAGSFGTSVANLLAVNNKVLLYARKPETAELLTKTRKSGSYALHDNITPTNDLEQVAGNCNTIYPVVPSGNFKEMLKNIAPFLKPYHILIHGTKGVNILGLKKDEQIQPENVYTMSQLITQETNVVRVGCLAGPNLASELALGQPAATVVASQFDEVIEEGKRTLRSDFFQVYGNSDLFAIELSGVLKNIIAISAGALHGLGYGENSKALLISRGLIEMIYIGRLLGANTHAFLGLAGVGDLVATCSSTLSRNFTVGKRLAEGEVISEILDSMEEVPEGINTVKIINQLAQSYKYRFPITETLYRIFSEDLKIEDGLRLLMKSPITTDINFL